MFDEITEIRNTRKKYNQLMFRSGIGTFREFEELEVMRCKMVPFPKNKELIALGISISQKCYG